MTYYYTIETRNGDVDYEFEPTSEDVRDTIKDIIESKTTKEIYDIMDDLIGSDYYDLEEYFYDELQEYFEDIARERREDAITREEDLRYDYYHDKL